MHLKSLVTCATLITSLCCAISDCYCTDNNKVLNNNKGISINNNTQDNNSALKINQLDNSDKQVSFYNYDDYDEFINFQDTAEINNRQEDSNVAYRNLNNKMQKIEDIISKLNSYFNSNLTKQMNLIHSNINETNKFIRSLANQIKTLDDKINDYIKSHNNIASTSVMEKNPLSDTQSTRQSIGRYNNIKNSISINNSNNMSTSHTSLPNNIKNSQYPILIAQANLKNQKHSPFVQVQNQVISNQNQPVSNNNIFYPTTSRTYQPSLQNNQQSGYSANQTYASAQLSMYNHYPQNTRSNTVKPALNYIPPAYILPVKNSI